MKHNRRNINQTHISIKHNRTTWSNKKQKEQQKKTKQKNTHKTTYNKTEQGRTNPIIIKQHSATYKKLTTK